MPARAPKPAEADLASEPQRGFSYEPSAGYASAFTGPALNQSGHFGLFLGGSLPRGHGRRRGELALGVLVHAEFPVVVHRYQLAIVGLAGGHARMYWRASGGMSVFYDEVGRGAGAAIGYAHAFKNQHPMAMTFAATCFIDLAGAANVAPGVAIGVVRF